MVLDVFARLDYPGMERRKLVLQAITEVIGEKVQGTSGDHSATQYFAALLTSIESDGAHKEDLAALLAMVRFPRLWVCSMRQD